MPYLKFNDFNILPYAKEGGVKWSENDLDGQNAGRTKDGKMYVRCNGEWVEITI